MLRTSHKLILWNIWKYKGISAINIFGLSVGMASSILLLLWVNYHRQFDKFHEDSDHVYRVIQHIKFEDITTWAITQGPLGPGSVLVVAFIGWMYNHHCCLHYHQLPGQQGRLCLSGEEFEIRLILEQYNS